MRRAARSDAGRDELSRRSLSAHKRLHFSGILCGRYIKVRRSYNHAKVKVNTSTVIQDFSIIVFFFHSSDLAHQAVIVIVVFVF